MTHKKEIERWAFMPDGTKVWARCFNGLVWELTDSPKWLPECFYVVDDKHAKLRMEWLDKGKPPVQFLYKAGSEPTWSDVTGEPVWGLNVEYRFKPMWYKNIPKHGIFCRVWDSDRRKAKISLVVEYDLELDFPFRTSVGTVYTYAEPLTADEAAKHIYTEKDSE